MSANSQKHHTPASVRALTNHKKPPGHGWEILPGVLMMGVLKNQRREKATARLHDMKAKTLYMTNR